MKLTIDLSQGHRVDEIDERFLLLHLGLPVPPLQVPEEQEAVWEEAVGGAFWAAVTYHSGQSQLWFPINCPEDPSLLLPNLSPYRLLYSSRPPHLPTHPSSQCVTVFVSPLSSPQVLSDLSSPLTPLPLLSLTPGAFVWGVERASYGFLTYNPSTCHNRHGLLR